jgi:hypothetical protein
VRAAAVTVTSDDLPHIVDAEREGPASGQRTVEGRVGVDRHVALLGRVGSRRRTIPVYLTANL